MRPPPCAMRHRRFSCRPWSVAHYQIARTPQQHSWFVSTAQLATLLTTPGCLRGICKARRRRFGRRSWPKIDPASLAWPAWRAGGWTQPPRQPRRRLPPHSWQQLRNSSNWPSASTISSSQHSKWQRSSWRHSCRLPPIQPQLLVCFLPMAQPGRCPCHPERCQGKIHRHWQQVSMPEPQLLCPGLKRSRRSLVLCHQVPCQIPWLQCP